MNIDKLNKELQAIKYDKSKLVFLSGDKKKFQVLINELKDCQLISVRKELIDLCQNKNISKINTQIINSLAKEIIPNPADSVIALIDNEFFLKYKLFSTTMKGQAFQNTTYIIHLPDRYQNLIRSDKKFALG